MAARLRLRLRLHLRLWLYLVASGRASLANALGLTLSAKVAWILGNYSCSCCCCTHVVAAAGDAVARVIAAVAAQVAPAERVCIAFELKFDCETKRIENATRTHTLLTRTHTPTWAAFVCSSCLPRSNKRNGFLFLFFVARTKRTSVSTLPQVQAALHSASVNQILCHSPAYSATLPTLPPALASATPSYAGCRDAVYNSHGISCTQTIKRIKTWRTKE